MKKLKHITSIIAAVTIFCSVPVLAADTEQIQSAWSLYSMGLFSGTGINEDGTPVFELDSKITRAQTVALIVRLMGKTSEAEGGDWATTFTDLPDWAESYIGYAYTVGYASGISSTKFDPDSEVSANQFCAFILRALGYSESKGDFTYDNALSFANEKGIANASYENFTRGDAAEISYNALTQKIKGSSYTLYDTLLNAGIISETENTFAGTNEITVSKTSTNEMTAEEIYEKCSPAVFYIEVYNSEGKAIQLGSGFFISSDGTAVTNYHVLDGGSSAKITLSDSGKVYNVLGVYDYDVERDIALIKIDGNGFSYLETADSDDIKAGATVYAIGSPLGLSNTISQGIISNTNRIISGQDFIQTSAAISNGSSGGALINTNGEVIGITSGEAAQSTSSGTVTGQNLNLAIAINYIDSMKKSSLTSLKDVYEKENKVNAEIAVSAENIELERGRFTTVTVKCSADAKAYLTGSLSDAGVASARFTRTADGAALLVTGINTGSTQINLKMKTADGTVVAEKTIKVTVK